jgi:hypothetical protein
MKNDDKDYKKTAIHGAFSGIIAKSIVAPLDRLKIIFQTTQYKFTWKNLFLESNKLIKNEGGVHKLWKGNMVQILRVAPNASLSFSLQKYYKSKFTNSEGKLTTINGYIIGLLSGTTCSLILHPLDTLRCRVAVDISKTSTHDIIKNIIKTQGIFSLYSGITVSTLSMMPYSSLSWGTYYYLNNTIEKYDSSIILNKNAPLIHAFTGFSSVLFAQSIVYPFDVWRRRIQTNTKNTQIQILENIMKEKALFKGLSINFIKTPTINGLVMLIYKILEQNY